MADAPAKEQEALVEDSVGSGPFPSETAGQSNGAEPGDGSGGDEDGNKFQKAIAAWRNIDLSHLIPTLDTTASDLAAHQRDALVERKELAQKTKDFRKLDDTGKLAEIKGLLKAYQVYIDLITNQSKAVSTSFFHVYSSLSEAPDPYPLLEASVESLVVADETLPKLQDQNKHLQLTNSKLSTQIEELESTLQEERKAKLAIEESQDARVKEIEASWTAVLAEKQDNWESRERNLEERAENQERLLKEIKASYEVSQRLGEGNPVEGRADGAGSSTFELEIISSELERANARLADVESRNEQLRLDLAQAARQKGASPSGGSIEDDPAFLRLRSENSSLMRRMDGVRYELESERAEWEKAMRALRKEVGALKDDNVALKAKVDKWSDYDEVKKELDILKSIEFSTGDFDDFDGQSQEDRALAADESKASAKHEAENLEQLLLARNKKLNNELTVLRVSHQDLSHRLETLQENLSSRNAELERSKQLTATLENDLARVQGEAAAALPAPSVAGTYMSRYPPASSARRGRFSPASSIISGIDPSQSASGTLESLRATEQQSGSPGILPMVTAQRDRFKGRISELESELSSSHQLVSSLRSEVASLQKDNLTLYEKTRYVSTYGQTQAPVSASAYPLNSTPASISISDGNTPLDRYRSAYESKISPFAAFRGRESARAFKRMTLPERALFQVARFVLANRASRNLFAVYFLGLHIWVFFMLFRSDPGDIPRRPEFLPSGGHQPLNPLADDSWHPQDREQGPAI